MSAMRSALREEFEFDPKIFLSKIGTGGKTGVFARNHVVFSQGDPADAIFYIQKGKVKLTVSSAQGKVALIAVLGAGDFFGEGCLASQSLRMSTAATMGACSIMRLEKSRMNRILHDEPAFSKMFVAHLLSRAMRVEKDLVDQLFSSTEKRLAQVLLLLANFGKDRPPETAIANVSREALADLVGVTRAKVSFFMNKFRKLGFIDYGAKLKVHSSLLNVVLHDTRGPANGLVTNHTK